MTILFHKFPVTSQVFHLTKYTYVLVNLKPLVPGHVLVVPLRNVPRLSDLPSNESDDFFRTIQLIQKFITTLYKADASNIAIQDGAAAGQSVPHVHCHIIPRYFKDGWGDGVYESLERWEGGLIGELHQNEFDLNDNFSKLVPDQPWYKQTNESMHILEDEERSPRTMEVMEKETAWLKEELEKFLQNEK